MLTASFPAIGTLDETLPPVSDPLYQVASLSLDVHKTIKSLSDNGLTFRQAEESDLSSFTSSAAGSLDDYVQRYEELLLTGTSAVAANLPDVLPIMGALLSGGAEPVIAVLLQGVLDAVLRHKDRRTDHYDGDTAELDVTGLEAKLDLIVAEITAHKGVFINEDTVSISDFMTNLEEAILGALTTLNINLFSRDDEQFHSVGPLSEE